MKKLILAIAVIALFASCSKKQETQTKSILTVQNATANDFKGDWVVGVDTVSTTTNGQTAIVINVSEDGANFDYNNDGTGYIGATGTASVNFTYTVAHGTLYIHIPATLSNAGQDLTFTIVSITTKRMILRAVDANSIEDIVFEKS